MARPRQPRLKVFQAQFGFFDSVVAAPSQAAALRAWDTHQNLFASGEARVAEDEAAVAAALEHPGTPLRRAVGSDEAFQLEPASPPKLPPAPKRARGETAARARPAPPPKPAADRSALDAAEAALRRLDTDREREEAELARRQDELDAAKTRARDAYAEGRRRATAALAGARKAYRAAGDDG